MKRPFLFLIMPITPRSETRNHAIEFLEHIREGIKIATKLIANGWAVYCPGTDFTYWFNSETILSLPDILEQDLEILKRCDVVYALPGWRESPNCAGEWNLAVEREIPHFDDWKDLMKWRREVWKKS